MIDCSYDTLEEMYTVFDYMDNKANEYVPTLNDMQLIKENLAKYLPFLLWIEETGYDTEENIEIRTLIKHLIKENLHILE